MKLKKKTAMILSFAIGSLIFATTALADIASKGAYEQLKDSLKFTAESCSDTLGSYTMDFSYDLKDNGKILTSNNQVSRNDTTKNAQENLSSHEGIASGKSNYYSYSDLTTMISRSNTDSTFYVMEYTEPRKDNTFNNPFKNDRAEDAEKIADAVIGSLKEQVLVKENSDGTKDFNGSLSEVQIPTLINAIASYTLKQDVVNNSNQEMPPLTQDIFVKEIQGTAHVNAEGLLENILGTATIIGMDEQGNNHEVTVEVLVKLSEINSTVVTKPDLTGQKVSKQVAQTPNAPQQISNSEKFIGKFKNDIVIEREGKFIKIGERVIEITEIKPTHVVGRYYEEYKPGFEDEAANKQDFSFDAPFNTGENKDPNGADVEVTNDAGGKTQIQLHFDGRLGKIYLSSNRSFGNQPFDSTFSPVLE